MRPIIIDVHAHVFNGGDIPLEGYLYSRKPESEFEKNHRETFIPAISKHIRRKVSPKKTNFISQFFNFIKFEIAMCQLKDKNLRGWGRTLGKRNVKITQEMIGTYEKSGINLYVPLMIDFEYWFKSTVDHPLHEQIKNVHEKIIIPYKGLIHPFVPFCPARELAKRYQKNDPDGKPENYGSLDFVKDAIENKGFIGVKLYNALGYKPLNNASVDENRRKNIPMHREGDKQGYFEFTGEDYDNVLKELYEYCVDNQVPITAHCIMDGIESYPKASWDVGEAKFWRDVLDQQRFKNLRLNLAHFGWNQQPDQGYSEDRSWVKDICEMFNEYDYLFTDVSHHRVILDEHRQRFISDYREICHDYPIIKKRLLFGIDWHVIKRVPNYKKFKDIYVEVLMDENLFRDNEIDAFLGGNALNFLGLLPNGKNRERLEKFYEKEGIDPPEWFKLTSS